MLVKIHPENPAGRHISRAVEVLNEGGIIIYPTDSVYAFGCSLNNTKAIQKLANIKGKKAKKANFSVIFNDLSQVAEYTLPIDDAIFKVMKKNLPGPYTFILPASKKIPKIFDNNKKTIGVRIPDNKIPLQLVTELSCPILTTSVLAQDEVIEYTTDPELIYEMHKNDVDLVIHGGMGNNEASTVVDCTNEEMIIIREGIKPLEQ